MSNGNLCPMCAAGEVCRHEGRLDQSGNTYLPTVVWSCDVCGYARYEPALAAHWQPTQASPQAVSPVAMVLSPRRAA